MAVVDIMPPEPAAKHVRRVRQAGGSVTDAEFVTIPRGGSPVRSFGARSGRGDSWPGTAAKSTPSPVALLLQRTERALSGLSADMFSAVVAMLFLLVFGLAGGFSMFLGQDGAVQSASPLDITHVTVTPQDANGMLVLLINGIVENRSQGGLPLPSIRAELVRNGMLLSSAMIEPPVVHIRGNQSHGFSARVPHPGGNMPELKLSFAVEDASRS